jgi:hypothetical protein
VAGTYNITVTVGPLPAVTNNNCVTVSTTLPTGTMSMPNSSTGWSGSVTPTTVNNPLSFSTNELCTANVYLSNSSAGLTNYTLINNLLNPAIPIGGPMAQTYYTGTYSSANIAGIQGYGSLIIGLTDASGGSGNITQSFSILSTGPTATVTYPGNTQTLTTFTGGSTSTVSGTVLTYGGNSVSYEIGLFNSNAINTGDNPSTLVDLTSGGWQSGTLSGTTCTINYTWHVESNVSGSNFYIGIRGKDAVGNVGYWAFSQYPFAIVSTAKPVVTILWPTSGSVHYSGSSVSTDNVTWNMTDAITNQTLTYNLVLSYTNTGTSIAQQMNIGAGSTTTQGITSINPWVIPGGINATNCVITENVTDSQSPPNITTVRSGTFSVVTGVQPTASLTAPTGGQTVATGSSLSVTWTQSDTSSSAARLSDNISFSADGGATWATIAALTNMPQSSNTFTWAVLNPNLLNTNWPNVLPSPSTTTATNCKISVLVFNPLSGYSVNTIMSSPFTISPGTTTLYPATVNLTAGWNLVSLPLVPANSNIQNVLGSAVNNIISVWTFSGGGATGGSQQVWSPGAPTSLTTMVDGKGYWINANSAGYFTFYGTVGSTPPNAPPTYSEPAGWNLVGFKSRLAENVSSYLGTGTGANGASTYSLPITGFASGSYTSLGTNDTMTPGLGYWVYYNTAGVIAPPSQ